MRELNVRGTVFKPGRPKVAVPITGNTPEKIIAECEKAAQMPCDVIEWRADYYLAAFENLEEALCAKETYVDLVKILDDINYIAGTKPVIFTVRTKGQGGEVEITAAEKESIWGLVAQSQLADFIDVELFDENGTVDEISLGEQIGQIHQYGCKVILSYHDFKETPTAENIVSLIKVMAGVGPDISKVAFMANSEDDAKTLLKATAYLTQKGIGPIITIAMGEYGKVTRVAAGKYGSCLTFAAGEEASAPGQIDVNTMKDWLDKYYCA